LPTLEEALALALLAEEEARNAALGISKM